MSASESDDTVVAFARPNNARARVPQPDWDVLEKHYSAGASFRYLASLPESDGCSFKSIHKHSKKFGWQRNIAQEVKARVRTEMLAGDEPLPDDPDELHEALVERGVKKQVSVSKALQQKSEAAIEFLDFLEGKIREACATGVLDPLLSGGRLALGDVIKQFISTTQTLQGGGGVRYTHDLDAQKDTITPILPTIGRRSVPGAENKS